ncbi:MAG: glycosyltransferase [Pseudomonadota bacterium]|nr:glycosyltransferase [Pseudomonadota bacterium]
MSAVTVCFVTFDPDLELLSEVISRLLDALRYAATKGALTEARLIVVDNGPKSDQAVALQTLLKARSDDSNFAYEIITGHGNIGFGQGHNKAIGRSTADYHLILNPDVLIQEDAIGTAIQFMEENPQVGLLAPAVVLQDGSLGHLCKVYPSVLDLLLRGFAPAWVKARVAERLARYEMKCMGPYSVRYGVPLVSGSFMLFRRRVLEVTGGFSKDYFLYFEDFDLSLCTARFATIAYVPAVRIVHKGGFTSKKGPKHWWMFARSALTFFSHHGWKWY